MAIIFKIMAILPLQIAKMEPWQTATVILTQTAMLIMVARIISAASCSFRVCVYANIIITTIQVMLEKWQLRPMAIQGAVQLVHHQLALACGTL